MTTVNIANAIVIGVLINMILAYLITILVPVKENPSTIFENIIADFNSTKDNLISRSIGIALLIGLTLYVSAEYKLVKE